MKQVKMVNSIKEQQKQPKSNQNNNSIYISLGSNLGNKQENINKAISLLKEYTKITKISTIIKTKPVGYINQDNFLNCVIEINTNLSPDQLLKVTKGIEKKLKRIKTIKNGPRTIDLDILFYKNQIINKKDLIIPHSRLHKRSFVLGPLNEIAPELQHPLLKKTITQLRNDLKSN